MSMGLACYDANGAKAFGSGQQSSMVVYDAVVNFTENVWKGFSGLGLTTTNCVVTLSTAVVLYGYIENGNLYLKAPYGDTSLRVTIGKIL